MKDKILIDQISKSYLLSRNIVLENDLGVVKRSKRNVDAYRVIVDRIDSAISTLDDNDKYIIYNEVVLGKKGEWYRDYISTPTYYRHRKIAYNNFINSINK